MSEKNWNNGPSRNCEAARCYGSPHCTQLSLRQRRFTTLVSDRGDTRVLPRTKALQVTFRTPSSQDHMKRVRCEAQNNFTLFFLVNGERKMICSPLEHYEKALIR